MGVIRKIFPVLVFLLCYNIISAQIIISGKIIDVNGKRCPYTSVILKEDSLKNSIINYSRSDSLGNFKLIIPIKRDYIIELSDMGYEKMFYSIPSSFLENPSDITIVLKSKETIIQEVIIAKKIPIQQKGDTTIFDLNSFRIGDERTLEDLLKRIPGITVQNDGVVKVGDKEIEKIMVDGQDFFGKGYQMMSKNLPDHPLESLEILDQYHHNKLEKGITKSDKVALNVTLKETAKNIWFGTTRLASQPLNTLVYDYNISPMRFSKKNKTIFLVNGNNNGTSTNYINNLLKPKEQYAELNTNESLNNPI